VTAITVTVLDCNSNYQHTLDTVSEADEAAAVSRGWSRADRLRCLSSDAGCVSYRRYAPVVEPTISDFMLDQLTQLDLAIGTACSSR